MSQVVRSEKKTERRIVHALPRRVTYHAKFIPFTAHTTVQWESVTIISQMPNISAATRYAIYRYVPVRNAG